MSVKLIQAKPIEQWDSYHLYPHHPYISRFLSSSDSTNDHHPLCRFWVPRGSSTWKSCSVRPHHWHFDLAMLLGWANRKFEKDNSSHLTLTNGKRRSQETSCQDYVGHPSHAVSMLLHHHHLATWLQPSACEQASGQVLLVEVLEDILRPASKDFLQGSM